MADTFLTVSTNPSNSHKEVKTMASRTFTNAATDTDTVSVNFVSDKLISERTRADGRKFFSVSLPGICKIPVCPEQVFPATRPNGTIIPGMRRIVLGSAGSIRTVSVSRYIGTGEDGRGIYEYDNRARMYVGDIARAWAESRRAYRAARAEENA